jgi:hypothetical protein
VAAAGAVTGAVAATDAAAGAASLGEVDVTTGRLGARAGGDAPAGGVSEFPDSVDSRGDRNILSVACGGGSGLTFAGASLSPAVFRDGSGATATANACAGADARASMQSPTAAAPPVTARPDGPGR